MNNVMNKGRVPVKIWSPIEEVESQALNQLVHVANLPHVFKHVAVMPDVHSGKGATVGSVIATKGAVIPAAVGVDIGCGMMAVQLPFKSTVLPDSLKELRAEIECNVPVGQSAHKEVKHTWAGMNEFYQLPVDVHERFENAARQVGTLGGGNHFIELCIDTQDNVWVMLHSGSRNIGKVLADVFIAKAKGLMKQYMIGLPDPDLAYLVEDSQEFKDYWSALQWAQQYAMANREAMMLSVLKSFTKCVLQEPQEDWWKMKLGTVVNCHHNYAAREHHYGSNVIVTRKGAVRAGVGDLGIIPGSMGTRSYIVRGLGNPDSFCSCSHGAGRRMSRSRAKATFSLKELKEQTAGIECRKDSGVLDEIPSAYKDIDQVMEYQKDLVEIVATLKQVLCVKG